MNDSPAWDTLHQIQNGDLPEPPPAEPTHPLLDLIAADEILAMFPEQARANVSTRWIRKNVPGKQRIGRTDLWPRPKVIAWFMDRDNPNKYAAAYVSR